MINVMLGGRINEEKGDGVNVVEKCWDTDCIVQ